MELTVLPDLAWLGYRGWQDSCSTLRPAVTDSPAQLVEPLSLVQARDYLKLNDDPAEQELLSSLIAAARSQAEILQRRVLVSRQFDLALDAWPSGAIRLATPTISVDRVQYRAASGDTNNLLEDTDFIADVCKEPGVVMPSRGRSWPAYSLWPSSAITIRFTAGYRADDPFWLGPGARVKQGMMMLVAAWHGNRMPYVVGQSAIAEYPYAVTELLRTGARPRVI